MTQDSGKPIRYVVQLPFLRGIRLLLSSTCHQPHSLIQFLSSPISHRHFNSCEWNQIYVSQDNVARSNLSWSLGQEVYSFKLSDSCQSPFFGSFSLSRMWNILLDQSSVYVLLFKIRGFETLCTICVNYSLYLTRFYMEEDLSIPTEGIIAFDEIHSRKRQGR